MTASATLSEELAAAEQQAREAVLHIATAAIVFGAKPDTHLAMRAALERYGAVCRLAGRWDQVADAFGGPVNGIEYRVRAELARLMPLRTADAR